MKTTIIGGNGFIGSHLIQHLKLIGEEYYAPDRHDRSIFTKPLGNVIYCAGVTSDFRSRPFDTVKAHVSDLAELLENADFNSFLYLSSTRIYIHQSNNSTGTVDAFITIDPNDTEELFNLTKLTGESLCLSIRRPNVRIARLSNVCGDDFQSNNFIYSILKDAIYKGKITLYSSLDSSKDYISVDDVVALLLKISKKGKSKLYNVASGIKISNSEWVDTISKITGCSVDIVPNAKKISFPTIDIGGIKEEFHYVPKNCLEMTEDLISYLKRERN
ncbi:NAD-dependent epimerase/dehydratase family protein [Mesobacillus subterraneus]|uniref:NAD-dependent epimerase/dehydratase family protein n=1 Tax=Mesobacillus subterraneus TaxID=285983 RepID=UPI001CFEFC44|nr:SDR family oxidoreductase [Mesobacillus subterraneus]